MGHSGSIRVAMLDDIATIPRTEPAENRAAGSRWRRKLLASGVLALVALVTGSVLAVGFGRDPRIVESVLLDRPAPPLAGGTLDGGTFDLTEHRGRVAVVNVWASWCTACRKEHPELEAAASELRSYGVQFVGINTQDTVEDAQAFMAEMGGTSYPSVLDANGRKSLDWGVFGVPETFLIDAAGRVRAKAVGAITRDWLVANVAVLLQEQ